MTVNAIVGVYTHTRFLRENTHMNVLTHILLIIICNMTLEEVVWGGEEGEGCLVQKQH